MADSRGVRRVPRPERRNALFGLYCVGCMPVVPTELTVILPLQRATWLSVTFYAILPLLPLVLHFRPFGPTTQKPRTPEHSTPLHPTAQPELQPSSTGHAVLRAYRVFSLDSVSPKLTQLGIAPRILVLNQSSIPSMRVKRLSGNDAVIGLVGEKLYPARRNSMDGVHPPCATSI